MKFYSQLYFLSDKYFADFPDKNLMSNTKGENKRPYLLFSERKNPQIKWAIPISSQYEKFQDVAQKKIARYGYCNTLTFGAVLGRPAVLLIQNMVPVTDRYLQVYTDRLRQPICIDGRLAHAAIRNAREVLARERRGAKIVYPNICRLYKALEQQIQVEQDKNVSPAGRTSVRARLQELQQQQRDAATSRPVVGKLESTRQDLPKTHRDDYER